MSLKLVVELFPTTSVEDEFLLHLARLDETRCDDVIANEAHKIRIKVQYDTNFKPHVFLEGDLVLLYVQESDKLGSRKFQPMWSSPYNSRVFLQKGTMI